MQKVFIHGSGHKSTSWGETIAYMKSNQEILCPNLSSILNGKEASYNNLYCSFIEYCNKINGQVDLCGISLGGILALNYALDYPDKVKSLVLIGTPHKIPKVMFSIQNIIFRFLPTSIFEQMAFNKKDTFILGNSMKELDFANQASNIKCPTLIICGKKDRANIKSAYYLSEKIKNAKLKMLENIGHVVNEENPQLLAFELDKYYEEIDKMSSFNQK